jgi:hypothetical protein
MLSTMTRLLASLEDYFRPVPGFTVLQPLVDAVALRAWQRTKRPPPPRSVKVAQIRRFKRPLHRRFVETRTFYGDMFALLYPDFDRLHSIELSPRLVRRARGRFRGQPKITLHEGDSGELLGPLPSEVPVDQLRDRILGERADWSLRVENDVFLAARLDV